MNNDLIIGGDGLIGRELSKILNKKKINHYKSSRQKISMNNKIFLDLNNRSSWENIPKDVSTAFLLAGETSLKACEENPLESHKVNVENSIKICEMLNFLNCHVVVISSNLVFDGKRPFCRHDQDLIPQNQYGKQKLELEQQLAKLENISILRISKIVESLRPLILSWRNKLLRHEAITPFCDKFCAPITVSKVARILIKLSRLPPGGTYHFSGDADISYVTIAQKLAKILEIDQALISPIQSKKISVKSAKAELFSSLCMIGNQHDIGTNQNSTEVINDFLLEYRNL